MWERFGAYCREEYDKLKIMNFQEKREYIWTYYRFALIATGVAIALAAYVINVKLINPPKEEYLLIGWMGDYVMPLTLREWEAWFTDALVPDKETQAVVIDAFTQRADNDRFVAMVVAGDIDMIIVRESDFTEMAGAGYLIDLSPLLAEWADPNVLEAITPLLGYASSPNNSQTAYGIRMAGSPPFAEAGFDMDNMYCCMLRNSKKEAIAMQAMLLFFR